MLERVRTKCLLDNLLIYLHIHRILTILLLPDFNKRHDAHLLIKHFLAQNTSSMKNNGGVIIWLII
jgi:hypothetical protein